METIDRGGKRYIGQKDIGKIESSIEKLLKVIRDNPQGFTVSLDGEPVTSGKLVSPYKGRELIIEPDKLNEEILENI